MFSQIYPEEPYTHGYTTTYYRKILVVSGIVVLFVCIAVLCLL